MDDDLKTSIISAIRTLDNDAYRAWFGTKPPRMFARLASQVGFGSRVLDLEELPGQFFDDVSFYMGSNASTDNILQSVRATLNEGWYVTDLADYAGADGTRGLRFVKGPADGGMGDIDDSFARFMLTQLEVRSLPLDMMGPQTVTLSRNLLKRNPADPEVSFGDNPPYLSSRTILQIIDEGNWRTEEAGNGNINFYYQVDGVEFAYPSSRFVPNPDDLRLSVMQTPRGRGIELPGPVAKTREFGKSGFPAFDGDHRKQAIDDGVKRLMSFNPRPLVDKPKNWQQMEEDLKGFVTNQFDRQERNREIQSGNRDISFWQWVKGNLAVASGVPGVGNMESAQDVVAAGQPGPLTTPDDLRQAEFLQHQMRIINEERAAMGFEPTSLPAIEAARRGED